MLPTKLNIGLLLDSYHVQAWVFQAIKRIIDSDYAEILLVVLTDRITNRNKLENHGFLTQLVDTIDTKLFVRQYNAVEQKELESILAGIDTFEICLEQDTNTGPSSVEEIECIRKVNLDILVNFSHQHIDEKIASTSKYGVWQYCFGDHTITNGESAGYWEVIQNKPLTTAILYSQGVDSLSEKTLFQSNISTYKYSFARNRSTLFWFASIFLIRQIELLARLGEKRFFQEISRYNHTPTPSCFPKYNNPSGWDIFVGSMKLPGRIINELLMRTFFRDTWYLMYGFNRELSMGVEGFKIIMPPKDRFWADPHIIQQGNNYYIFIEEYIYHQRKGHISVIEIDSERNSKEPVPVLNKEYHLSYPSVFELDGTYFMIPESSANKTIDLYYCEEFPIKWNFKMTLLQGVHAVDTTVIYFQGKWWLFTGINENGGVFPDVELFVFFSDNLFSSKWTPHPLNPVISGATSSRPAGRIYIQDGKLYRPSQDCSKIYGASFSINEINCLSDIDYAEEEIVTIKADWDNTVQATHTYNRVGQLTVIDAFIRRPKLF
jgi:hypothetical protein